MPILFILSSEACLVRTDYVPYETRIRNDSATQAVFLWTRVTGTNVFYMPKQASDCYMVRTGVQNCSRSFPSTLRAFVSVVQDLQ